MVYLSTADTHMCFLLLTSPRLFPCFFPMSLSFPFPPCPFPVSSEGMWSRRCRSRSLCGCSEASRRASPTPSSLVFKSQCTEVHNVSCVCMRSVYIYNTMEHSLLEEEIITLRSTCSFRFYLRVAVDFFMCLLHCLRHLLLPLSLHRHCPHPQCY